MLAKIPVFSPPNSKTPAVDPKTGLMNAWFVKLLNDLQASLTVISDLEAKVEDLQNQIDTKCP